MVKTGEGRYMPRRAFFYTQANNTLSERAHTTPILTAHATPSNGAIGRKKRESLLLLQSEAGNERTSKTDMAGGGKRRPNHNNKNRNNQNDKRNAKTDSGGGCRRRSKSIRDSLFFEGGLLEDWSPIHSGPSANSFSIQFFFL